jgi:hypothetical protein
MPVAVDPLSSYRAHVERAESKGPLAVEIARAQLIVAKEYQAAGENLAHKADEILRAGQQLALDTIQQRVMDTLHADRERARPAAPPPIITDADRKRGDVLASMAVREFRGLAAKRKGKMAGYRDGQSDWSGLPGELRERIERFNTLTKDGQDGELAKMQKTLADEYARDPAAAGRDRKTRTIDKGRSR